MLTRLSFLHKQNPLKDKFVFWLYDFFPFLSLPFYWCPLPPFFFLTPTPISFIRFLFPSFVFHLSVSVRSFASSSFSSILLLSTCSLPLLLLFLLLLLLFSCFLTVRRMLWPLWPLTPSLWACRCHQGAEQEVEVRRRGQVRPSRNASTSPTSRSASETQTSARCLGYEFLSIQLLSMSVNYMKSSPLCRSLSSYSDIFSNLARSLM